MGSKPHLLYFDISAARAICPRIALFAALDKDGWTDETISSAEFGEERKKLLEGASSKLVSGSLPQLTLESGKTYCQSISIARWACIHAQNKGKDIKNLYPTQNPDDFILLDETMSFASEILDRLPQDFDVKVRTKKREEYCGERGFMGRAMGIIENRFGEKEGDFLLGGEPCLADLAVYGLASIIAKGFLDGIPKDFVAA